MKTEDDGSRFAIADKRIDGYWSYIGRDFSLIIRSIYWSDFGASGISHRST